MSKLNVSVTYGTNGNVYLTHIEGETVTDLISVPCPEWGDRKVYGEMVKTIGMDRDLY